MSRFSRLLPLFVMVFLAISAFAQHYNRIDLVQNAAGVSTNTNATTDQKLVNAWGLARGSGTFWWVSDNGTGFSTLYDGNGAKQTLEVTIPLPQSQTSGTAAPTGVVNNWTQNFMVGTGTQAKPALFLFVTEDGTISGWNPGVQPTSAVIAVDQSGKAIYKGVALAQTLDGPRLYATNFMTGTVDVFDANFQPIAMGSGAFALNTGNSTGPNADSTFSPFGIQNVGGNLVVTFAHRTPGSTDEDHGPGLGHVAIYDTNGKLLLNLQDGSWFNAPWGVALAPSDFGAFGHRLLIGNFGDGTIHAFNAVTGTFEGNLLGPTGTDPLVIDGLWALSFGGNSLTFSPTSATTLVTNRSGLGNELFFTAGPNDEKSGVFGKLTPVTAEQRGSTE